MKELLVRHLASSGFQKRFWGIYWPFIKEWGATPYNKLHNALNKGYYEEQMQYSEESESGEEIDAASYTTTGKPLNQEDAFKLVREYLLGHERQRFGMCVTHTVKNIFRFAAIKLFGGKIDFSEHDIYIDRLTRAREIDGGMNSSKTLDRVIEKGVAIAGVVPDPERELDLNTTRADYPDPLLDPFRIKLLKSRGYINARGDFEKVWAFITENYAKRGVRPFQLSITAMRGWWTSDVPTASGTVYGGHSAMGVTIPFMFRGKRAFFCFDSSFRSGLVWQVDTGVRIVTEDCWNGLGKVIRPVEFLDEIEKALGGSPVPAPTPTPVPTQTSTNQKFVPISAPAAYGQEDENVANIQKYLIHRGFDLPAITKAGVPYGYYGAETAAAIMKWQIGNAENFNRLDGRWNAQTLADLEGRHFGALSVRVMNSEISSANTVARIS